MPIISVCCNCILYLERKYFMQKDISMQTDKYVCLRDFSKTSTEITLVHAGKK